MWRPDEQELAQLSLMFRATLSSNAAQRKAANDALAAARAQPQFENYLCYLLVHSDQAPADVRAAAGVTLKNSVLKNRSADRPDVKAQVVAGLLLSDTTVRNITGNVITALFSAHGIEGWPQVLPQLLQMLQDAGLTVQTKEAAASALAKICEDSAMMLDREYAGERPLNHMIPVILAVATSQVSGATTAALLRSMNHLVPLKSQLVLAYLDQYLQTLFALALDESAQVRRSVCSAFLLIMENRPDKLVPHIEGVVSYCVQLVQDKDETVAMEACEFLLALSELHDKASKPVFRASLDRVLPVLLLKMVFSDEQLVLMEILDSRDDSAVADKAEDIRPNMAKGKDAHAVGKNSNAPSRASNGNNSDLESDDSDSDLDSDDEDELEQWNLRRCSAATLDALSLQYPEEVINISLPILQENIVSPEWPIREAAILAFGAISKSCMDLARDKLPTLVPFLVDRMKDQETRVRQITCWTLSRYATWVAEEAFEGGQYAQYFQPTFESVALLALDSKKLVQEAACSALSQFIEATDVSLIQYYVGPMMEHFAKCFAFYQRKNLLILYDCVGTFVDRIGSDVFNSHPEHANTLLPPLLNNWQTLEDTDSDLWPLLECMSIVAATMGESFAPYAVPVYERAVKILGNTVQLHKEVHTNPVIEAPEKDFMVTSLDLIDGLVQGFKEHSVELMRQHGANLMELVLACLEDHDDDVRQLAFALLGDLAIFTCEATVQPNLNQIVICAGNEINNCSYTTYAVTNNAIWSLGEIALKVAPGSLKPYISNIVNLLIPVLNSSDMQQTVLENAAICLGRLGLADGSSDIVPRLPEFIYTWCTHMMYVLENEEKESAFLGMVKTIEAGPDAGFGGLSTVLGRKNLSLFISCIGNYFEPLEKLREVFFQVLVSYKELLGSSWNDVMKLVDSDTRGFLSSTYGV